MEKSVNADPGLIQFARTDWQRKVMKTFVETGSLKAAAEKLGRARGTVHNVAKKLQAEAERQGYKPGEYVEVDAKLPEELERIKSSMTEAGLSLDVESIDRVQTGAEAIKKAGFDLAIWEPVKVECTSWEVAVKLKRKSGAYYVETKPLWRVKVVCRRRVSEVVERGIGLLAKKLGGKKFSFPKPKYRKPAKNGVALLVPVADLHFAKVSTLGVNDLKTTEEILLRAFDNAIDNCVGREITEIHFVQLGDFFNADNPVGTTSGTPQEMGTETLYSMYSAGLYGAMRAIERSRQVAPVVFTSCPGNHDEVIGGVCLAASLECVFRDAEGVSFNENGPVYRKRIRFGNSLISVSHGNNERESQLPGLLALEHPHDWAETTTRECWRGHLHHQRVKKAPPMDTVEVDGVVIRTISSLSPVDDRWHQKRGYIGSKKCSQAFVHDEKYGLVNVIEASIDQLLGK